MWRRVVLGIACLLIGVPAPTAAEGEKNRGLFITPVRQYIAVNPQQTNGGTLTVANITDNPATVTMSVEQFSTIDYSYDHTFEQPKDNWIKLSTTNFTLQPNKSQTITYTVSPPGATPPGGHYFAIFASATLTKDGAVASQVRAATMLYVTVNGELHRTSTIQKDSIPTISFGGDIAFSLDVKNTGNAHFFTYTVGELQGLTARGKGPEVTHVLLPNTSRILSSVISAPILPGIYRAVYGYRTDAGQVNQRERFIIYLPLWSLLIPLGIGWLVIAFRKKRIS